MPGSIAESASTVRGGFAADTSISPGAEADEKTVRRWLGGTTRRTGPRGRTDVTDARVIALRDRGCGPTEIARLTGLSRGAVRKRLARLARESAGETTVADL